MSFTKEDLKEVIEKYFTEFPNSSPSIIIRRLSNLSPELGGIAAAQICLMREDDKTLIITGEDENGVLLSHVEKSNNPIQPT